MYMYNTLQSMLIGPCHVWSHSTIVHQFKCRVLVQSYTYILVKGDVLNVLKKSSINVRKLSVFLMLFMGFFLK